MLNHQKLVRLSCPHPFHPIPEKHRKAMEGMSRPTLADSDPNPKPNSQMCTHSSQELSRLANPQLALPFRDSMGTENRWAVDHSSTPGSEAFQVPGLAFQKRPAIDSWPARFAPGFAGSATWPLPIHRPSLPRPRSAQVWRQSATDQ